MGQLLTVPIVERTRVAPLHMEMILHSAVLSAAIPGQFAHVLTPGSLRRPISFSRIDTENHEVGILFQIAGTGTEWLYETTDSTLDVMGPLGQGFCAPDPDRPWCLVGGGVGIPPMYAAVERWGADSTVLPTVILGARTGNFILMEDEFRAQGVVLHVATDDGSRGEEGTVIGPLSQWLMKNPGGQVFACGPTPMLRAVQETTRARATTYLALEQRMGCGIGACLACVVPGVGEHGPRYRRVCTEGPVFRAEELIF